VAAKLQIVRNYIGSCMTAFAASASPLGAKVAAADFNDEPRRCLNLKGFTFPWSTSSPLHPKSCQPFYRPLPS
jgi:hypothetical protein